MSMKHLWMDVVKRGTSALSSPRSMSAKEPEPATIMGRTPSKTLLQRRQSFALALAPTSNGHRYEEPENGAFVHFDDRCESVGACNVSKVLEHCVLQGGVHHTHMNILTCLGNPLRAETCCYVLSVQWFRAVGDHDDFRAIPDACDEWFTPTADDIGARILAKVMLQDEDAIRTKLLEYGPIREDPEVRSKVETYLERGSVLFMGLESVLVQDGENFPNNVEMRESWTLLIDDRRVRLTCESSLLPPFEAFYTSSIRVEMMRTTSNEFRLFLADNCFVQLRAESNVVRDIIVLTLRAFCQSAVSSELLHDAIAKGVSPMLTIRTLADKQGNSTLAPVKSPLAYNLPWNRPTAAGNSAILIDEDRDEEDEEGSEEQENGSGGDPEDSSGSLDERSSSRPQRWRTASDSSSVVSSSVTTEFFNDSVLQDADALIGNAMKMGLQQPQPLLRAPKRISVTEIPDLQIIEAIAATNDRQKRREDGTRQRNLSMDSQSAMEVASTGRFSDSEDDDEDGIAAVPSMEGGSIEQAIANFMTRPLSDDESDVEALRRQYVAIFCELQKELKETKARATSLRERLEQTTAENKAFKSDVATLQDALSSIQIAEKVKELVANDLDQVIRASKTDSPIKRLPQNFY
ncbi:hypothetical protein Poli38472_008802 [Pythium oligandrum]|uniref:Uncharacterized protein n=1 Tax=Pythium oligandrum TaxID=41045 RepID=A0A8K1C445_PYTOL|nr:hypothetical protein Poli38472_008802 [Pythium oligandrum]|eukprot:TMW56154.1 hypothetical protein Poli38472_008802 [Pythium oligandrum]